MKSQHIAVIFIIIILPISMVMFYTIGKQIDTIKLQNEYNTGLNDATYDAVNAFKINTVNNRYSSISSSKIRDIEASINTFFTSLSDNEPLTEDQLKSYVPALVYTLYDGYYIYSKYDNVYPTNNGQPILDEDKLKQNDANYGLKPYIYYSCRYKTQNGTKDFIVNYTLDNAITVYGNLGNGYETKSGYLIAPELVTINSYNPNNPLTWKLTYDDVNIIPEQLTEHLIFADKTEGYYDYIVYNGQKIYYDKSATANSNTTKYFYYQDYGKGYIPNYDTNSELINYLTKRTSGDKLYSTSSFEYYYNAKQFSQYIKENIGNIKQSDAVDADNKKIEFSLNTGNENIFNISKDNDPLISTSTFNENRKAVIRMAIETNLVAAIANFNIFSSNTYEFKLPVLNEFEWEKITNNVSMISFLQGIPIGYKYYNNYCVITNNNNEEVVKAENIYIIAESETGEREYHLPGCKQLLEANKVTTASNILKNTYTLNTSSTTENQSYVQISGSDTTYIGKTETLTISLISNEPIGVISGKITKNEYISKIDKVEALNGWNVEYNSSNGFFKAVKAQGASNENVIKITYTAGSKEGSGEVNLNNIVLTNLDYNSKNSNNIQKYISITKESTNGLITLNGVDIINTEETETVTIKLTSNEKIGVISGNITKNGYISKIDKIEALNGWSVEYNSSKGSFKAVKAQGASADEVIKITYTAGDKEGIGIINLSNIKLTNLEYQEKKHDNVSKNITIEKVKLLYTIKEAYANISFLRQTVRISEGNYLYFYPLTTKQKIYLTGCYHCMVNSSNSYGIEDIIKGEIITQTADGKTKKINSKNNANFKQIRELYIRALGRERYHLYQVNMDSFNI